MILGVEVRSTGHQAVRGGKRVSDYRNNCAFYETTFRREIVAPNHPELAPWRWSLNVAKPGRVALRLCIAGCGAVSAASRRSGIS